MIQESINNLIFSAGINARLLPSYQRMMEAQDILGKARSAQAGIADLQRALSDESKSFSETEYNDMRKRLSSLNRDFYTAKIRSHTGDPLEKYLRRGVDGLMDQKELSPIIKDIELKLAKGRAGNPPDVVQGIPDEVEPLLLGPGHTPLPEGEKEPLALNPGQSLLGPGPSGLQPDYRDFNKSNRLQNSFKEELNRRQNPLLLNPGKGMLDGYVASPKEKAMESFEQKGVSALEQKNKFFNDLKDIIGRKSKGEIMSGYGIKSKDDALKLKQQNRRSYDSFMKEMEKEGYTKNGGDN